MRDQFATQAVREIVACIQSYIVSEYMAYRTIEIQLVPETFGLLLFGLAGMMKAKPDITDDELALLIAQTLRIDMTVMDPPPQIKTAGTDPLPIPAAWYLRSLAGVALLAPHPLGDPLDEGDLCPLLLLGQLVADFAACKAALG